jgi:hypothetical protein
MKIKKLSGLLLLAIFLLNTTLYAQEQRLITGTIEDAVTKLPIPFATITLKNALIGTVSNENGKFDLYIPKDITDDRILAICLGYQYQDFDLTTIQSPLFINLIPSTVELKEVTVSPLPPTYYIKLAMSQIKENYPQDPFLSTAYYREKVMENENFIRCNEGVFKSYYPNFQDTVKNQHQLLLYRKVDDLKQISFMQKERDKDAAKEKKKEAKAIKKGKTVKTKEEKDEQLKIAEMFGGPERILALANLSKNASNYLDSTEFKNYNYSFAKTSSYKDVSIMVINFKSKGKNDHVRESGKIYLDISTNAIVKTESKGEFSIPTLVRPVLFVMGLGIENPTWEGSREFQQVNNRWYPKNVEYTINLNVEKKRMFSANDNSNFIIEGIFTVNKLQLTGAKQIEVPKRYIASKNMEEQVHNEDGITWSGINIIKK